MADKHAQKRPRHVPVRSCVVCRTHDEKRSLTRVVHTDAGVVVDASGKLNGRGAYLCGNGTCWQRAVSTSVLEKALRTTLSDADRQRLEAAKPSP